MTNGQKAEKSSRHTFRTKKTDPLTEWLENLPEGEKSYHLRAALRLYKNALDQGVTSIETFSQDQYEVTNPSVLEVKLPEINHNTSPKERSIEDIERNISKLNF